MENWKVFRKTTKAVWEVSDWGNIRKNGKDYTPFEKGGKPGNRYYTLSLNEPFNGYVHRIVAHYFIPNPERHLTVNHKDGNKRNNHVDNLEWTSYSTQLYHAYETGLNKTYAVCWDGIQPYKEYLKQRREQVCDLKIKGYKNWQIAKKLGISSTLVYHDLKRSIIF